MKKLTALFLAAMMALCLVACGGTSGGDGGGKTEDPNLGKYIGYEVKVLSDWEPIDEVYSEGDNYIELNEDGKCTFCMNGDVSSFTWTLEDTTLKLTMQGQNCEATLKDGVITITNFFGMEIEMTFVKEGMPTSTASDSGTEATDTPETNDPATESTAVEETEG